MLTIAQRLDRVYGWFLCAANALQSPLLLLVRLYWGWQFWQTGWGKVTHISHVIEYFTSLGLPAPALTAYFIAWLETIAGILLVLGLFSRLVAVPLVIDMIVAYIVGDRAAWGSFISDPGKFYGATPYTFLFASLLILSFGPGKISVDSLIAWYRQKHAADSKSPVALPVTSDK